MSGPAVPPYEVRKRLREATLAIGRPCSLVTEPVLDAFEVVAFRAPNPDTLVCVPCADAAKDVDGRYIERPIERRECSETERCAWCGWRLAGPSAPATFEAES